MKLRTYTRGYFAEMDNGKKIKLTNYSLKLRSKLYTMRKGLKAAESVIVELFVDSGLVRTIEMTKHEIGNKFLNRIHERCEFYSGRGVGASELLSYVKSNLFNTRSKEVVFRGVEGDLEALIIERTLFELEEVKAAGKWSKKERVRRLNGETLRETNDKVEQEDEKSVRTDDFELVT